MNPLSSAILDIDEYKERVATLEKALADCVAAMNPDDWELLGPTSDFDLEQKREKLDAYYEVFEQASKLLREK